MSVAAKRIVKRILDMEPPDIPEMFSGTKITEASGSRPSQEQQFSDRLFRAEAGHYYITRATHVKRVCWLARNRHDETPQLELFGADRTLRPGAFIRRRLAAFASIPR